LLAGGLYTAALVLVLALGLGSDAQRVWVADVGLLPVSLLAIGFLLRAARESGIGARTRRAWLILAIAFTSYGLANLVWAVRQVALGADPESFTVGLLYLAYYPLLLWGLLTFPTERGSRREARILWLDAATVLVVAAMVMWHVVFLPVMGTDGPVLEKIVSIGYPTADLAILFAVVAVLLRNPSPQVVGSLRVLLASVLLVFLADFGYALATVTDGFDSGSWPDALWTSHEFLAAVSAQLFILRNRTGPEWRGGQARASDRRPSTARLTLLPYGGILLGYGLVLYVSSWSAPPHLHSLLLLGGVLIVLIVSRQVVAVRETERAREALRESEKRFKALVQHASDLVTVVDPDGVVAYQGSSAERILGRSPLPAGAVLEEHVHADDQQTMRETLAHSLTTPGSPVRGEWRLRHASGMWRHLETFATSLVGDGVIDGIVLNSSDITERKTMEEELMHRAFHDPLTGVANRALFSNILDLALIRSRRSGKSCAVLFLDLDNFKTVNDALGHSVGDSLLVQAAERLKHEVRVTDAVARLGGDEFAVLLDEMTAAGDAVPVTDRILAAMQLSVTTSDGSVIEVTASVGLAISSGVETREEMLLKADSAMYEAKRAGGNRVVRYTDAGAHVLASEALEEADLRRAIELGEFALRYQPIVSLVDNRLTAVEALVRWFHPRQGLLPPEEFMSLAERSGLDIPLGYHVLEEGCRQVAIWRRRYRGADPLGLNLKISLRQLRHGEFAAEVRSILGRSGLRPDALVLEVTEQDLLERQASMLEPLESLRAAGVRIAVGDFGAGCRVLNTISELPIDLVRLDSGLIEDLKQGASQGARAVIGAARDIRVATAASGADTRLQAELLATFGCDLGLGQHLGSPMSRDQLEEMLRKTTFRASLATPEKAD
jgi:diguanylate cyclase (GGDEF)-like protein/PAS domain S-box-containing protein